MRVRFEHAFRTGQNSSHFHTCVPSGAAEGRPLQCLYWRISGESALERTSPQGLIGHGAIVLLPTRLFRCRHLHSEWDTSRVSRSAPELFEKLPGVRAAASSWLVERLQSAWSLDSLCATIIVSTACVPVCLCACVPVCLCACVCVCVCLSVHKVPCCIVSEQGGCL